MSQRKFSVSLDSKFFPIAFFDVDELKRATEMILRNIPSLVNLQKDDGYSGLHLAALNGHKELIEVLIKFNADLNLKTSRQQTPLLFAITQLNVSIIDCLIENSKFKKKIKFSKYFFNFV